MTILPLDGVRVIDFTQVMLGPCCTQVLADYGAEVIKIEKEKIGDLSRWSLGSDPDGLNNPVFCSLNRNKKSIVVDLRTSQGRALARTIAEQADVLIENSRPGAMERLGLGYEALRAVNPRLIYCSITGFGQSGPYSERPGYDTVGQATSGLLSLLTDLDAPKPMGVSLSDHLGGLFGCYGVLAALAARERTGRGQHVDTSLLRSSLSFLAENVSRFVNEGGRPPTRATRTHSAQVYAFRDACWYDWDVQIRSMERLARERFEWILPGHGRRCHFTADEMAEQMRRCVAWMKTR